MTFISNPGTSDEQNLDLAQSVRKVDEINTSFYGRIRYPWPPTQFDCVQDPYFERHMLLQEIGDWDGAILPKDPSIWIAGCGTNQAVFMALRYPNARILGSDISEGSLEVASTTARELGINNLELRRESLNEVGYHEQFDMVVSTGVIHHNADPKNTLARLSKALKPSGLMEMMVYNRYHRILSSAFQKGVRLFGGHQETHHYEKELNIAKALINRFPEDSFMATYLTQFRDVPEAHLADSLLQPVEYSYTVESFNELMSSCGLEIVAPYLNIYDKIQETYGWNMVFDDEEMQAAYDELPDLSRWQVTNCLLVEKSPMLWFTLQRQDSGRALEGEHGRCRTFLDRVFEPVLTEQRRFNRQADGRYQPTVECLPFPLHAPHESVKDLLEAADGKTPMRELFKKLDIPVDFHVVNQARIHLTTPAFPYLRAV